jgi:hypothetical protein
MKKKDRLINASFDTIPWLKRRQTGQVIKWIEDHRCVILPKTSVASAVVLLYFLFWGFALFFDERTFLTMFQMKLRHSRDEASTQKFRRLAVAACRKIA